jgi:hypothetical protein
MFVYTMKSINHDWELDMKTTINIRKETLNTLTEFAKSNGMSRSELIALLLKKVMGSISNPGRFGTLVRYQKRARPADWHKFHVRFRPDDYEYFLDLRRLVKMSVSCILQYAVEKYLPTLYENKSGDNYLYTNYVLSKEIIQDVICWRLMWGYPPAIGKILNRN